jgi:hypothetical protein
VFLCLLLFLSAFILSICSSFSALLISCPGNHTRLTNYVQNHFGHMAVHVA